MMLSPIAHPDAEGRDHGLEFLDSIGLLERLHRLLNDTVKDEFERLGVSDLTPVQAMLIYNLGGNEVSASELRTRGYYQGSNVSYNLKKLVQMGYVHYVRCTLDRRSIRVSLTPRGADIRNIVLALFQRHAEDLGMAGVLDEPPLPAVNDQLRRIARYWHGQIRYIY